MYPEPSDLIPPPLPPENIPPANQVMELQRQLAIQAQRIRELEKQLPQTNLISPNFLTRAFAVWGHYFVSNLIIGAIFTCIAVTIMVAITLITGINMYDYFNY